MRCAIVLSVSLSWTALLGAGCSSECVCVTGKVAVEGTKFGVWGPAVSSCRSGVWEQYHGAEFRGPGTAMKIVVDPIRGPTVLLQQESSGVVLALSRDICPVFDIQVDRGITPEGGMSSMVEGLATFSCNPKNGGVVRGKLGFRCF